MALVVSVASARPSVVAMIDDEHVVERCQAGDQDAFRLIVERYGDAVFGTAVLMTSDRALAEDLTQEAFVRAWRGIDGFRPGSPLKPWLLRIVVNGVISSRRRRVLSVVPLPWAERAAAAQAGPEAIAEQRDEHEGLRCALRQLPREQQRLLILRYFGELSVPEIARALRWREGTVKSRLHRALLRMRALLEDGQSTGETGGLR